jgi:hypothetical protein
MTKGYKLNEDGSTTFVRTYKETLKRMSPKVEYRDRSIPSNY